MGKNKNTGSALDNCAIYILNSQGELVERGQIGEVFVSGAHVAGGYINGTKTSSVSFMSNSVEKRKGPPQFLLLFKRDKKIRERSF